MTRTRASSIATAVLDRFRRSRARTRALFDLLDEAAYYERPIALRNPIVFYEGHLPAFAVNTLIKKGARAAGHRRAPRDDLRARHRSRDGGGGRRARQPGLAVARRRCAPTPAAADRADRRRHRATPISSATIIRCCSDAQALWTILEHEEMHQETLAYMWHQLPYALKRKPEHYVTAPPRLARLRAQGGPDAGRTVARFRPGTATLGTTAPTSRSPGTTSCPAHSVRVDGVRRSTCTTSPTREFLEFVEAGGYRDRALVAARGLGLGAGRARQPSAVLGARRRRSGTGAACSSACRCRSTGRST